MAKYLVNLGTTTDVVTAVVEATSRNKAIGQVEVFLEAQGKTISYYPCLGSTVSGKKAVEAIANGAVDLTIQA